MKKSALPAVLFSLFFASPVHAAFDYLPVDARGTAMSGATTALSDNTWGIFSNPAATGQRSSAAVNYTIPYGDSDLGDIAGAVNLSRLPFDNKGTWSIGMNRYSANDYHETIWLAGYARELLPSVRIGVSIARMTQKFDGFGDDSATGINAGLQASLSPMVTLGISSMNLNSPTIGETDLHLPRTTLAGATFHFPTGSLLTVNLQTDPDRSSRLLAGGDFVVAPMTHLMIGLGTNPSIISGGASFGTDAIKATIAVSRNLDLGTTSSFGLEAGW
ncbi:MAG TPA: hypothetical protein ENL07_08855 [Chlorobaculum parvum]|uniref:Uncharacterized protein n=1 Tax=Chlorobaculum parvum TaxID=274539 RepID=A0A7C5DG48_9CHLB|nr:hypothetical protein [Chlorobaculum parvum]